MDEEALEKRLAELRQSLERIKAEGEAMLEQIQANGNATMGAISECEYWLAVIKDSEQPKNENGEGVKPSPL